MDIYMMSLDRAAEHSLCPRRVCHVVQERRDSHWVEQMRKTRNLFPSKLAGRYGQKHWGKQWSGGGKNIEEETFTFFSPSLARSPQYTYELGGSKVSEISSSSDVKFLLLFLSTISTRPLVIYRLNCSSKSEKRRREREVRVIRRVMGEVGSQTFISRKAHIRATHIRNLLPISLRRHLTSSSHSFARS